MTIHSDWGRLLHSECPEAFLQQIPTDVDFGVGIIDGHLQLMCLNSGLGTWERFLQFLFVNPIKKLLDAGCPVVVLCFDSYDSVPIYKSMTQQKRAVRVSSKSACGFVPGDELPETIPHDAMTYMMNRSFKLKVIDLACALVPGMVMAQLITKPGQRLIVDYKRVVEYDAGGGGIPRPVDGMVPTGESDIKFARYVDRYGHALVHAIDGDYMAIALLYYTLVRAPPVQLIQHPKIFIFRQLAQLAPSAAERKQMAAAAVLNDNNNNKNKRKRDTAAAGKKPPRKKTPKCWVDMQLLFSSIANSVRQSMPPRELNRCDAVHAAVVLMLCAGTDFSRPMPLLGPKRIWEGLPLIADALLRAAPRGGPLNLTLFSDGVLAPLYKSVFARHVVASGAEEETPLREVIARLRRGSSLSTTTTGRLPSEAQVLTTLKNISWVVHGYWTIVNGPIHAPLDGSNGFIAGPNGRGVVFSCDTN